MSCFIIAAGRIGIDGLRGSFFECVIIFVAGVVISLIISRAPNRYIKGIAN